MKKILFPLVIILLISLFPLTGWAFTTLFTCDPTWPDSDLPVGYMVNENPPSTLPDMEQVRDIFEESFNAWSDPCCSRFSAVDLGLTGATGENQSDSIYALSFIEGSSWPSTLGDVNSTLGVTLPIVDSWCDIVSADVVFNQVGFTFVDGNPGMFDDADLQSIATHEFGHFLGMGHSPIFEATMYASYTGGTGARSLHQDDLDGVCYLYEQSCDCETNEDCFGDYSCIDGVCQLPPCESDDDCDPGLTCVEGDCIIPPCESDADCAAGYVCEEGACIPDANCPICGTCTTNADCGSAGVCIPAGVIGADAVCTAWCEGFEDCPGNTECFIVPTEEGNVNLCFNEDADVVGPCPPGFVCIDEDEAPADLCEDISCPEGQICDPSTGDCVDEGTEIPSEDECLICDSCDPLDSNACGAEGTCLTFTGGGSNCSLPCDSDGSCPYNSRCFQITGQSGESESWCFNDDAGSAGICSGDWVCEPLEDLCEDVTCEVGETCDPNTGECTGGEDTPPDDNNEDSSGNGTQDTGVDEDDDSEDIGLLGCGGCLVVQSKGDDLPVFLLFLAAIGLRYRLSKKRTVSSLKSRGRN